MWHATCSYKRIMLVSLNQPDDVRANTPKTGVPFSAIARAEFTGD